MATTEVILKEKIHNLGAEADIVKVRRGFARNFLIPQGKAYVANEENKQHLEELQAKRAEREATEVIENEKLVKKISKLTVKLKLSTGQGGKVFGSVTPAEILKELNEQHGIELHKSQLLLKQPIKEVGKQDVDLKIQSDMECKLKLDIAGEKVKGLRGEEISDDDDTPQQAEKKEEIAEEEAPAAESSEAAEAAE